MNSKALLILGLMVVILVSSCTNQRAEKAVTNEEATTIVESIEKGYAENARHCESDEDCKIVGQFADDDDKSCSCCRGCASHLYSDQLTKNSRVMSACWPVYGCKCVNNTCAAIDYIKIAVQQKDSSICQNMIFDKGHCLKSVAIALQNTSICFNIDNNDFKYSCLATIKKDEAICGNIDWEPSKELCYEDIAVLKEDPLLCEKCDVFKDDCFKEVALLKSSVELCERIVYEYTKIVCLAIVKKDSSICEKLPSSEGSTWMKNDCIAEADKASGLN